MQFEKRRLATDDNLKRARKWFYTVYAYKQMVDRRRISKGELDQRLASWKGGGMFYVCGSKTDDW